MKHLEIARKLRPLIEKAVQSIDGNEALTAKKLYPIWTENTSYTVGFKVQYNDKLWRCIQAHNSVATWEPENAVSLWEQINETHAGTLEDPIPYSGNMALENGKYYMQDYVVYLCTRDTINPVYNNLSDLVGIYVALA